MPETNTATNTDTTPAPAEERIPLVTGRLRRERGRALLTLDVSKLHQYLDFLGVSRDTASKRFANAPQSRSDVIDTNAHAVVPKVLCSFEYKKNDQGVEIPGVIEIDILRHYTTPPNEPTLKIIAETVKDAANAVITHYQPVEISIAVIGKKAR